MTVLERLDDLLDRDTASRWRMLTISALIVAGFGLVFSGVNHKSPAETLPYAMVVGVIVFVLQALMYCTRSAIVQFAPVLPRRIAFSALAAGLIIFLAIVPARSLEGKVLDRRLLAATQGGTLTDERAKTIKRCLDLASEDKRVQLPEKTLTQVQEAIAAALNNASPSPRVIDAAKALSEYTTKPDLFFNMSQLRGAVMEVTLSHSPLFPDVNPQYIINLVTSTLQANPPTLLIPYDRSQVHDNEAKEATWFYAILLQGRAEEYYKIGEFERAVADCRTIAMMSPPKPLWVPAAFGLMVASYLRLGKIDEAIGASSEFYVRTGDRRLLTIVEGNRSDPSRAIAQILGK